MAGATRRSARVASRSKSPAARSSSRSARPSSKSSKSNSSSNGSSFFSKLTKMAEVRFAFYLVGLYTTFLYWGMLQEKLTSTKTKYVDDADGYSSVKWSYPLALNAGMAFSAYITATAFERFIRKSKHAVSWKHFWKAAATSAMASPLGYASLRFISFPLMILTKSCKPVPVMVIGFFRYAVTYPWYKYVSVALLSSGIALFCAFQPPKGDTSSSGSSNAAAWTEIIIPYTGVSFALPMLAIGIVLVLGNLTLDGFTNNEQDYLFMKYKASSVQMMGNVNLWQTIYLTGYLMLMLPFQGMQGEIVKAFNAFLSSSALRFDLGMFFLCASIGQLLIFTVMEEFGSLTWVTIGITRKMFTILLSVFLYNHQFNMYMWGGVGLVFAGMFLEVYMKYATSSKAASKKKK